MNHKMIKRTLSVLTIALYMLTFSGPVQAIDIPEGTIAGYFPECNPLIPLWHHAKESKVPAAKAIDVIVERLGSAA